RLGLGGGRQSQGPLVQAVRQVTAVGRHAGVLVGELAQQCSRLLPQRLGVGRALAVAQQVRQVVARQGQQVQVIRLCRVVLHQCVERDDGAAVDGFGV